MKISSFSRGALAILFGSLASTSAAAITYNIRSTDSGTVLIVSGAFAYEDDISLFRSAALTNKPIAISFDSPGGNVLKAMELGRQIRALGLATIQVRGSECASACSLAFLGGTERFAQPGSIGVHKASFGGSEEFRAADAVSAVQHITADVMTYMLEMGVDPALLQLSLRYDSDDIRYLSGSEMAQYHVTTGKADIGTLPETQTPSTTQAAADTNVVEAADLSVPRITRGVVRHPKGAAPLKVTADGEATVLENVRNGSVVPILAVKGDWYRAQLNGRIGYLHNSWVLPDTFANAAQGNRFIQVKSFSTFEVAKAYVKSSSLAVVAHLAANGWFAIALAETFDEGRAKAAAKRLKAEGSIPEDAFITYGNNYVRPVCCDR